MATIKAAEPKEKSTLFIIVLPKDLFVKKLVVQYNWSTQSDLNINLRDCQVFYSQTNIRDVRSNILVQYE
jgi:hypothetical protein